MSLKTVIQSMIAKANTTTGRSDTNLTSAINALVDGYGQGGGISGVTELYSNDSVSITYTSTSAGTAKSITGITGICTYPLIVVIVENNSTTSGSLKFIRSATVIPNTAYASGGATITRYGSQQYYNSSSALTNAASTTYGLWGYSISTSSSGTLTIRGRCNTSYYTSLTGTYKVRVLGIKF